MRFPRRFGNTSASRHIALARKVWDNTKAHSRNHGRLAQRERKCLTSTGSGVQIPQRPPDIRRATGFPWPVFVSTEVSPRFAGPSACLFSADVVSGSCQVSARFFRFRASFLQENGAFLEVCCQVFARIFGKADYSLRIRRGFSRSYLLELCLNRSLACPSLG